MFSPTTDHPNKQASKGPSPQSEHTAEGESVAGDDARLDDGVLLLGEGLGDDAEPLERRRPRADEEVAEQPRGDVERGDDPDGEVELVRDEAEEHPQDRADRQPPRRHLLPPRRHRLPLRLRAAAAREERARDLRLRAHRSPAREGSRQCLSLSLYPSLLFFSSIIQKDLSLLFSLCY